MFYQVVYSGKCYECQYFVVQNEVEQINEGIGGF